MVQMDANGAKVWKIVGGLFIHFFRDRTFQFSTVKDRVSGIFVKAFWPSTSRLDFHQSFGPRTLGIPLNPLMVDGSRYHISTIATELL